jgi:hypothetical protein
MTKLQSVQNAAARFISKSQKFDHITPIPAVRRRVKFEVAILDLPQVSARFCVTMGAVMFGRCGVKGSTLAFGSTGRGFDPEHR